MERKTSKLEPRQDGELEVQPETRTVPPGKAFGSVDELLRYDANRIEVPAELQERLAQSVAELAPTARPWWRRWLGK
jgi:hypothetical protein